MKTILLIENKPDILENLTEAFEMEGYKILAANNGIKGVELARKFVPDLIISAILIGNMSGYEVLCLLLETHKTSTIPFIFSTTQAAKSDKMLAFKLGANDYIVKPYELEDMFAMAKRWITSGRSRVINHVSAYPRIVYVGVLNQSLVSSATYN